MAIKDIIKYPNPVLIEKCIEVEDIESCQNIIEDIKDTLEACDIGAGLAAPQIGYTKRIFAIKNSDESEIWINPEIRNKRGEYIDVEACLSLPGISSNIKRASSIKITGLDEEGHKKSKNLYGFYARVFQHELDHLNGILFIDKVPKVVKRMLLRKYRNFNRKI